MSLPDDRLTVEALRYYVPLFHRGEEAEERLVTVEGLGDQERCYLEVQARLKPLVRDKITSLCLPLMTREINKLIAASHLKGREDLFDILYAAAVNGMMKGLRRFEVDKLNRSSTNYLFQWIVTYAKKELSSIEAPFGIAPSRFQKYKKVSAVRKRLSSQLGRYATNEEVLEYFHDGRADIKTLSGRLDKPSGRYASNLAMTLELVAEQEDFEKNLSSVILLDPLEDWSAEVKMVAKEGRPFSETLIGCFLDTYDLTAAARAVISSEAGAGPLSAELEEVLAGMSGQEYRRTLTQVKAMMTDEDGPFMDFVRSNRHIFEEFDSDLVLSGARRTDTRRYLPLFSGGKIRRQA